MNDIIVNKTRGRKSGGMVTILSLFLIVYAAKMVFVFNISDFYVVFISSLLIAGLLIGGSTRQSQRNVFAIAAVSIFLWIVQSELIKYRHSPLVPYAPTGLASIFPGMLMGYVFVSIPISRKVLKILMYVVLAYFFIALVIFGDTSLMSDMSEKTSDVGILNLTMALIIPVMYLDYRDKNKISILPLLIQLAISLMLESRTGLGTCALLAAIALLCGTHSIKNKGRRFALYIFLGLLASASIYLMLSNMDSFAGVSKSMDQGVDLTGRAFIWANYFENFSFQDLIFGRDIIGINEGDWQNAHNSWIQLHSMVGFIGIIIMAFYLWVLFSYLKYNLLFAGVMFVMIFFSFFNKVYFFSSLDWCVYIFFFDYLMNRNNTHIEKPKLKMSLI